MMASRSTACSTVHAILTIYSKTLKGISWPHRIFLSEVIAVVRSEWMPMPEGRDRYLDPKYAFKDDDTVRRYIDLHRGQNRRGGGPHYDRREDLP